MWQQGTKHQLLNKNQKPPFPAFTPAAVERSGSAGKPPEEGGHHYGKIKK